MSSSNSRTIVIGPEMEAETRLKALAENSEVDIDYAVKATRYVRSGREMLRSAVNYRDDGNLESAYVLYLRFLTLFVDKFHSHPGYKDLPDSERKLVNKYCRDVFPVVEAVKGELLKKFKKEHDDYCLEKERYKRKIEEMKKREDEERKREAERQTKNIVSERGSLFSPLPYSTTAAQASTQFKPAYAPSAPPPPASAPAPVTNFPTKTKQDSYYYPSFSANDSANFYSNGASVQTSTSNQPQPEYDRKNKPSRMLSPNSSVTRPVIIPYDIGVCFMSLAEPNTKRKIETCGVLMGKIISGGLVITHLIIPNQKGTPDSCDMENEEDFIPIQDKHNIITIGWIHTHPTQTSFLSSVDLHTHYSYQLMMPEAIAIVCSPLKNETGVFTLTQLGMDMIGSCTAAGFHPHAKTETPIFEEASHASFDHSRQITILDIRGGS